MAGILLGNVAGAVVSFFRTVVNLIVDAIRWIKQAILKLVPVVVNGIREAVKYERTIVREVIRFMSRHESVAWGLTFAVLFDVLGVNA